MKGKESWLVLVVMSILTFCHPSTPHALPSLPWGFDPMYLQSADGSDPDLSPKDGPFWPLVPKWNLPVLVREGRADNFIRFGRTQHDQQEFPEHEGSSSSSIDWSGLLNRGSDHRGVGGISVSRASKSYKKKNNFIRLGRENPRQNNFIRLGRSGGGGSQDESLRHWNIVGSTTVNGAGRSKETDAINGVGESHENMDYGSMASAVN